MRIHENGDYAYDLEQTVDPRTQLRQGWRFTIVRIRPVEQVLYTGEAASREEAEKQAKRKVRSIGKERDRAA